MLVIAELIRKGDVKGGANITVRGVDPAAFTLRPQLKIVTGRTFTPGLRELIVGGGVLRQFQGAEVGKVVRMRGSDWTVVGRLPVRRCARQRAVDRHQRRALDLRAHRRKLGAGRAGRAGRVRPAEELAWPPTRG